MAKKDKKDKEKNENEVPKESPKRKTLDGIEIIS
jgi:hypothetical protein